MADGRKLARKHHLVPQFYLRGFANGRDQLAQIRLPSKQVILGSVENACARRDFYMLYDRDGNPGDDLELLLADVESHAARVLRDITKGGLVLPSEEQRARLSLWLALQWIRGPRARAGVAEISSAMRSRKVFDDFLSVFNDQRWHLEMIMDGWQDTAWQMSRMDWWFIQFKRHTLATSDSPLIGTPPADDIDGPISTYYMPLNRRLYVIMRLRPSDFDIPANLIVPATTDWARRFNRMTAVHAHEWVYHHPDDNPISHVELHDPSNRRVTDEAEVNQFFDEMEADD